MLQLDLLIVTPALAALVCAVSGRIIPGLPKWVAAAAMVVQGLLIATLAQAGLLSGARIEGAQLGGLASMWSTSLDGLSTPLMMLTVFIGLAAVIVSWDVEDRPGVFFALLMTLQTALTMVFLADNLILFYVGWESVLVPMYFLIGGWGSSNRRHAATKYLLYSFAAGAIMLLGVILAIAESGGSELARALGTEVTRITKQPVVVDDKPGAAGFIGAEAVKKAAPDGYTVFITTNTTHAANEHLFKKLPYDPVKDFLPVTGLGKGGQIMIVNLDVPAKTVAEFIALAKSKPGKISFGSGSSSSRVAGEMFQQMAGIDLLHVPYKSNPLAINDLLGGQINMMITDMATGLPQVKGGKVRALGVSTLARSPQVPDLPTISEAVKGYDMSFWFAAYVPANTPPAVVNRLHDILVEATKGSAMQGLYSTTGIVPFVSTPAELGKFQAAESEKWKAIIKKAGIEPE